VRGCWRDLRGEEGEGGSGREKGLKEPAWLRKGFRDAGEE